MKSASGIAGTERVTFTSGGRLPARNGPGAIAGAEVVLAGQLAAPVVADGIALFANCSRNHHGLRNCLVAQATRGAGLGTLLSDWSTGSNGPADETDGRWRFDLRRLARRLVAATRWIVHRVPDRPLRLGYFGASISGAAASVAAARLGRAGDALPRVAAPNLLVGGGRDERGFELNDTACADLRCRERLTVIPGATHWFAEPGERDEIAALAAGWFRKYLKRQHEDSTFGMNAA